MLFQRVCLESIGYTLPEEVVTTAELERRLAPLYRRLRLPEGRLELITGVRERRFWPSGMPPGDKSVESGQQAIGVAGIDRLQIGALIHASVCRDHLEPATACRVHHRLDLRPDCQVYDISNACLGLLNGMVQVACLIELGQISAGLVVGTESSRSLVETTIEQLNRDTSLTRQDIKSAVASLTIGSGSCAILLTDREISSTGNRLLGGVAAANTKFHRLCHSGRDEAGGDAMRPLMQTDSEQLMAEGIATGAETFARFLQELGWTRQDVNKAFSHQVGPTHRRLLFDALQIDSGLDYPTVEYLGNTGSVALPLSMALGVEQGWLNRGDQVALLGIGSGINCLMLAVDWQRAPVEGGKVASPHPLSASQRGQSSSLPAAFPSPNSQ
ncbi:MAG: 3-oxoacyl-ACP synthase III [Planctomycetales bacterium]|nr:3-oxoacyl-ACP synthase III [Planctomycetales bacterium]NIM09908.1 3-oxoacyl-ACP synthase III [Planctomycetales bacterium]NIN09347.1 3-oxoacyl-ACP synthase III [Planctomycetales bacterium]NIN78457.1 3-oxoacyl-ACP synthase III [Planctomycetales bacterium]NIO35647.1 3-oxoacyl-ACP synthase III [Planctomycetales bacterium]